MEKNDAAEEVPATGGSPHLYVTSAPQQAIVTMNNQKIGKTPLTSTPEQGNCKIGLSLPGYQQYATDITVTPQLNDTLAVVMIPERNVTQPTGVKISPKRKILRYSLGGAGIVSTIAGIVSKVQMSNAYDKWHSEQDDPQKYTENEKDFHRYLNNTLAGFGIGLLCASGLALTFVF